MNPNQPTRVARLLNRLLKHRVITNCAGQPYLRRWYLLRTKWLGVFIHQFIRSDEDRALHDHPWDFIVMPIWRGYIEHNERRVGLCMTCEGEGTVSRWLPDARGEVCHGCDGKGSVWAQTKTRVLPLVHTRYRPGTYRHRVELLRDSDTLGIEKPAWSIFIRFRKVREWGFWQRGLGFIHWAKWWRENKCED